MAAEAQDSGSGSSCSGGSESRSAATRSRADAWPARRAAELVQLLALADGHRLARDQVIDALWPQLDVEAGAANLRKAAHHARQALGTPRRSCCAAGRSRSSRRGRSRPTSSEFEVEAAAALAGGDADACAAPPRLRRRPAARRALRGLDAGDRASTLRSRQRELLRAAAQWERLVEVEPTDEPAYRELMRRELDGRQPAGGDPLVRAAADRAAPRARHRRRAPRPRPSTTSASRGLGGDEPEFVGRQLELARVARAAAGAGRRARRARRARARRDRQVGVLPRAGADCARPRAGRWSPSHATEAGAPTRRSSSVAEQVLARDPALLDALGERGALGARPS